MFELVIGAKVQLKLSILIFWTKFTQKKVFPVENRKMNTIAISKFQLRLTIWSFWTKFAQESYFRSKAEKSNFCVRPWSLLTILNFSARGLTDTMVF